MRPSQSWNLYGLAFLLACLAVLVISTMAMPGPRERSEDEPSIVPVEARVIQPVVQPVPARVELPVTDCLVIQVHDPSGQPIPGAEVHYYREQVLGFAEDLVGAADAAGVFRTAPLESGNYRLRVSAPDFLESATLQVEIPAIQGPALAVVLRRQPVLLPLPKTQ